MDPDFFDQVAVWGLRVAYAAAILGVGLWIAVFLSRFVRKQAEKHPRIDSTLGAFFSRIVKYAIIIVVIIAVLQMFGVQTASLVAVLGAGALAIGLALQGTLGNVASGIIVAIMRPYHIGDYVEINGKEGQVVDLDLLFTELKFQGRRVIIPNGQAISNPIINYTVSGRRRCIIQFGVGYEDDLDQVLSVLEDTMMSDSRALPDPAPWFGVMELGDFAITVSARVWVKANDHLDFRVDMIKAVKEAFDREGIDMPYPHSVEINKGEIQMRMPPIKPKADISNREPSHQAS
jgi:small conductance mechanosensitive channel